MWRRSLGSIQFSVEHRCSSDDRGPSLCVSDAANHVLLRFDCLYRNPAYHVDPKGLDEHHSLPPLADNIAWTLAELERNLAHSLSRAGFDLEDPPDWSAAQLTQVLVEAEAAMRNPPAGLQELELDLLAARHGEKWSTYPEDILPAWVAEMDFPLAEPIRLVLQRAADRGDLGYPISLRATGLPEVFAQRMQARFDWGVEPSRTEILSDVVQGMYIACVAYAPERPGAVVQTPIYPPFLGAVKETGRRLIDNALVVGEDRRLHFDLERLRHQVDEHTGMLLLCNPHNPSGRVYRRDELEVMAEIVLERDLFVVSDEIHGDLVYDGARHIPFASISPEVAARTVTLTSATKAFNIPGLRCAVAHFGSAELQKRFNEAVPRHARGGIGLLGIHATLAAWQHSQPWLDEVLAQLDANRSLLGELLAKELPELGYFRPEATYLAWLDCRALDLEPTPATRFLRGGKVALSDGRHFGAAYGNFARINFATSGAILTQVVERMKSALASR
jgi:cystathionine beta-lyase